MTTQEPCLYKELYFDGNSYVEVKHQIISSKQDTNFDITVSFTADTDNGLILWKAKGDNSISLGLRDGKLEFELNFGNGATAMVRSERVVATGERQTVKLYKRNIRAELKLNNEKEVSAD